MPKIVLRDFHLGGKASSKWIASKNHFARAVGFDIHSTPGLLKVNQKMTKIIVGDPIDEFCKVAFEASNGIQYWFSSQSGKIWQNKAGTVSLVFETDLEEGEGEVKCLGGMEYRGYIYWATEKFLLRIPVGDADGAAAWTANVEIFNEFTVGDLNYHPMEKANLVLYIGDANLIAQVDGASFIGDAMDMDTPYRATALVKDGTDLMIGTIISSAINLCSVFTWNTWGVSFSDEKEFQENGINSFIKAHGYILANAGQSGNLYLYTQGAWASVPRQIPGDFSPTARAVIYPYATGIFKGSPIFGLSNVAGNPTDQGIYSLVRKGETFSTVINLEFPISQLDGNGYHIVSNVEIGATIVSGTDVYCSWRDSTTTPVCGMDKLDYSNKIAKPFMELPVLAPDRVSMFNFSRFSAHYEILPANTNIIFKTKKNFATAFGSAHTAVKDALRNRAYYENSIEAKTFELRMECVSSGNDAPTIEEIENFVKNG